MKKAGYSKNFKHRRVTGIIVHKDFISVPRLWLRKLRAALHELKNNNLSKEDPNLIELVRNIEGRCAYAMMVNKEKYTRYYNEFQQIKSLKFKN